MNLLLPYKSKTLVFLTHVSILYIDQRVLIYPAYIDVEKSVAEGRRIPKSKAAKMPFVEDMMYCVQRGLNLPVELEVS